LGETTDEQAALTGQWVDSDHGVRGGPFAEVPGEALLAGVVQTHVREHQGLALIECRTDRGDGVRVQLAGRVDSTDLGADPRRDLAELQPGAARR
jgi:hypothetical protein